jgi:hypothetical protein
MVYLSLLSANTLLIRKAIVNGYKTAEKGCILLAFRLFKRFKKGVGGWEYEGL